MAKITGSKSVCDRCGQEVFYADGPYNGIDQAFIDGWDVRVNKDLCPNCVSKFDEMIEHFFDGYEYCFERSK